MFASSSHSFSHSSSLHTHIRAHTRAHTLQYPFIFNRSRLQRYRVKVSLSGREKATWVTITLCSRTENKAPRQTKHLRFHNTGRRCLSANLRELEVARTFRRSQALLIFTHLLTWCPGRFKTWDGVPGLPPSGYPQALLYAPVSLDICPESEDV